VAAVVDLLQHLTVELAVAVQVETQESAQQEQQTQVAVAAVVALMPAVERVVQALLFFLILHHLQLQSVQD
jgi:hypothetical protein